MKEGWNRWKGKRVFIRTNNHRVYSGVVTDVDYDSPAVTFITIKDKFNLIVSLANTEIIEIKEETK